MSSVPRVLIAGLLALAGCAQPRVANEHASATGNSAAGEVENVKSLRSSRDDTRSPSRRDHDDAVEAFQTIHAVFMHPRCQNCHIPGDSPLQFDEGRPHAMSVVRGPEGHGAEGLACASCHGEANTPAHFGPHAPPGAPHWGLPPPHMKMAWIGMSPRQLCEHIKDTRFTGGRDLAALVTHVSTDKLVLWGWNPGGARKPVPVPHDQFVAQFRRWVDAGGPCPKQ